MKENPKEYSEFAIGTVTRKELAEMYDGSLVMYPDHDNAIIGVVERVDSEPILCYNIDVIIQNLIEDGMSERDAYVSVDDDLLNTWAGDRTPCVISMMAFIEDNEDAA